MKTYRPSIHINHGNGSSFHSNQPPFKSGIVPTGKIVQMKVKARTLCPCFCVILGLKKLVVLKHFCLGVTVMISQ